jgi:hypothetical protein
MEVISSAFLDFHSVPEEVRDQPSLFSCELEGTARNRICLQPGRPIAVSPGHPTADGSFADVKRDGDLRLLPAELLQLLSVHPPPLPPLS